jgi:beta-alanine degradation protein BauB
MKAETILRLENDEVRVTEYRFARGAATGHHRHAYDYVIVPLTDGRIRLVDPKGEGFADLKTGVAYFRKAGVEHDVFNAGNGALAFVEVELKDRPG